MNLADYHQWTYVTVYDIKTKHKSDFQKIRNKIITFNLVREANLLDSRCKILKKNDTIAIIPKSYNKALKYFKTN